jgi:mannose-1-phosphate guanylyltransferase
MAEAIILVGGEGTRLRPLTEHTPKPMLAVAGVPLVVHQIAKAAAAGIEHIVLATSYKAEVFDSLGDGAALGVRLDSVVEEVPLGTGGAIRNAAERLDGDAAVVILNGDILSGHDLTAQLIAHRDTGAAATLHLVRVADPRAFGCVPTDADGRITAFLEKSPEPVTDQINAGCYVFDRAVIDTIPVGRPVSVERETFPGLIAAGAHLHGHLDDAEWLDLGTPQAYLQGCLDMVTGQLPSPALPGLSADRLVLADAQLAADAVVDGGSVIGPGCRSVLLQGARVGAGAQVIDSVVGNGAVVGARVRLDGVVAGDGVTVPDDAVVARGARLTV